MSMKKTIIIFFAVLMANSIYAQGVSNYDVMETVRIVSSFAVLIALMIFILSILKRVFEHRLKNKIVDKGVNESITSSILQSRDEGKHVNIKWFALLAAAGAGLLIVNYTQPLGIHSLAIMALSISAGFLSYFIYLRFFGDK